MKKKTRLFIGKDGTIAIEDPSPLELELLRRLGFSNLEQIQKESPLQLTPRRVYLKDVYISCPSNSDPYTLLTLHNEEVSKSLQGIKTNTGNCSLFDLKRKIFISLTRKCTLCGYKCKSLLRLISKCPVKNPSHYYQYFVHIGEEREIGNTLVIELTGCNLSCKFCQKAELRKSIVTSSKPLTAELWKELREEYKLHKFNSISFLGGNPDQSFLGILDFLEKSPRWASDLPIVWHTNGYSSPFFYQLLYGLVDILVFDFKYFNDQCAYELSKAIFYKEVAKKALKSIIEKELFPLVIVRHLILPGHWECCQKPLIDWLCRLKGSFLFHPMNQYKPLGEISQEDGELNRTLRVEEFTTVWDYALKAGLSQTL